MKYLNNQKLYSLNEITRSFPISRKELLELEEKGLIEVHKDKDTSYRYYESTIFIKLNTIRLLKNSGLSLFEIKMYFEDSLENKDEIINILKKRKEDLETSLLLLSNINKLSIKEMNETIYYYEERNVNDLTSIYSLIKEVYNHAIAKDYIFDTSSPFILINKEKLYFLDNNEKLFKIKICLPLKFNYNEKNISIIKNNSYLTYEVNNLSFIEGLKTIKSLENKQSIKIKNDILYFLNFKNNKSLTLNHKFIIF